MKTERLQRYTAMMTLCGHTLALSPAAWADSAASTSGQASDSPPTSDGSKATVTVRSTGDPVTVAQVTARMAGAGVGSSGQTVSVQGLAWKDICISPCSFELDPGLYELMVYGDSIPAANQKLDLGRGQHDLLAKPGSSLLQWGGVWLTALGILTAGTGVLFLFLFTESTQYNADGSETKTESGTKKLALPLLLGGLGGTGVGIGLLITGKTSFERDQQPGGAPRTRESTLQAMPIGVNYTGTF